MASDGEPTRLGRRSFLRGALAGVAGVVLGAQMSGCSDAALRRADDRRDGGTVRGGGRGEPGHRDRGARPAQLPAPAALAAVAAEGDYGGTDSAAAGILEQGARYSEGS